jgi:hypothetical protein
MLEDAITPLQPDDVAGILRERRHDPRIGAALMATRSGLGSRDRRTSGTLRGS